MKEPFVSILMAVYNAEKWLDEALDSLLVRQTFRELEVLAVDDASTDGSLAILQRRAAQDERLRVFHQAENQGQAVARNIALAEARGAYIMMVDADDWLSDDAISEAVSVVRQFPQTQCVVFTLKKGDETSRMTEKVVTGEEAFRQSLDWRLHGLYMVSRELHKRYPYDASYRLYSDDNTSHLHYLHSAEVRPCNGVYYYRQHPESSTAGVSPNRFLHMMANLSLRKTLVEEGVSEEVLAYYDKYRWHVYLGQLWLFFTTSSQFEKATQQTLRDQFREVYATFGKRTPYCLFLVSQRLRWWLKKLRYGDSLRQKLVGC